MGLDEKVAIVSGGSRGIGKEVVLAFVRKGAKVAFTYFENARAAEEVVQEASQYPGEAKAFKVDIRDRDQVAAMVREVVGQWGTVDILVNNAGIRKDKTLPFMGKDDWNDVFATNVNGTYHLTQSAVFHMLKKKKGRIVNISSISGISGIAGQTNYSASKAAILGFTRSLAKEVAPYGVSVNAIVPGGAETDMLSGLSEKKLEELIQPVPMKRLCKPEEVAKVALFLADEELSPDYLTGAFINLDGGIGT